MYDELQGLLMEQLQLLHEQSRNTEQLLPSELVELSNAMANIAGVAIQIM